MVNHGGIPYDVIKVSASAVPEKDWEKLKADWKAHDSYRDDPDGKEKHMEWYNRCVIRFEEEFWFDISDFYKEL